MNRLLYLFTSSLSDGSIHRANRIQTLNVSYALGKKLGKFFKFVTFGGYTDGRLKMLGFAGKGIFHKEFSVNLAHFRTLYFLYKIVFFRLITKGDVLYCRDIHLVKGISCLKAIGFVSSDVYFEAHEIIKDSKFISLVNRLTGVIAISGSLKKSLKEKGVSIPVLDAHDGVNMEMFAKVTEGKAELREKYELGREDFLILYTGNLYKGRGIEIIVEMASSLKEAVFVIVGGTSSDIEFYKALAEARGIENIIFKGFFNYSEIPSLLKTANLLMMPYTKETRTYQSMSPLKLFEYMASKVPVLCSDIGTVREVLNEDLCYFFDPEKVESAIEKVREIKADYSSALKKAEKAYLKVDSTYSWEKRACRVIDFIQKNSGEFSKN